MGDLFVPKTVIDGSKVKMENEYKAGSTFHNRATSSPMTYDTPKLPFIDYVTYVNLFKMSIYTQQQRREKLQLAGQPMKNHGQLSRIRNPSPISSHCGHFQIT